MQRPGISFVVDFDDWDNNARWVGILGGCCGCFFPFLGMILAQPTTRNYHNLERFQAFKDSTFLKNSVDLDRTVLKKGKMPNRGLKWRVYPSCRWMWKTVDFTDPPTSNNKNQKKNKLLGGELLQQKWYNGNIMFQICCWSIIYVFWYIVSFLLENPCFFWLLRRRCDLWRFAWRVLAANVLPMELVSLLHTLWAMVCHFAEIHLNDSFWWKAIASATFSSNLEMSTLRLEEFYSTPPASTAQF